MSWQMLNVKEHWNAEVPGAPGSSGSAGILPAGCSAVCAGSGRAAEDAGKMPALPKAPQQRFFHHPGRRSGFMGVNLSDVAASPWRNGGGVTRELVAWPDSQDWIWRMSVAEVDRGGPFSSFLGVQRWFAVLAGAGVRLTVGKQTHALTRASPPFCFDGAAPVDCELLSGPTQDFNLMLRADRATARMARIAGVERYVLNTPKTVAVYAIASPATLRLGADSLQVPPNSLAWQVLGAGAAVQVESSDALWMEIEP